MISAEAQDAYADFEAGSQPQQRRDEYQPIAQFDHKYQSTGTHAGAGEGLIFPKVVAGAASSNNPIPDEPPSYAAVDIGGIFPHTANILNTDCFG